MGRRGLAGVVAAVVAVAGAGGAAAQIVSLDGQPSPLAQFDAGSWADAAVLVGDLLEDPGAAQQPALLDPFAGPLDEAWDGSTWVLGRDAEILPSPVGHGFELGRAYRAAAAERHEETAPAAYDVEFNAGVLPEPMTWGMMIIGFFGAGWVLRRHKQTMLAAWPGPAPTR